MIVRISNEGQYELPDAHTDELNDLDNQAVSACEAGEESRFYDVFERLLRYVREKGTPLPPDELMGSDIILPPADVSLQEAQAEFQGEGLIPG